MALIHVYAVSAAGKKALGICQLFLNIRIPKTVLCKVRALSSVALAQRLSLLFSMWHERTSQMPDKGGQPLWHKPEADG